MAPVALPWDLSLDGTLGVTFVSIVIASFLSGTTCLQTVQYYRRYRDDTLCNKLSVAALWFIDISHTICIVTAAYFYFVTHYGDPYGSVDLHWPLKAAVCATNIQIVFVHTLYAVRIWKLSKGSIVGGAISVMVIVLATAAGCFSSIGFLMMKTFFDVRAKQYTFYIPISIATFLDVTLACTLFVFVKPRQTTFANAHSVVTKLLKYTLASGIATGLCAAIGLITFFALPTSLLWIGSTFVMTKLYATSYLALLSSRKRWRDKLAMPNMDYFDFDFDESDKMSIDSRTPITTSSPTRLPFIRRPAVDLPV